MRRLRADDAVSTRAAPGLRPPGHYEPAARSSLTEAQMPPRSAARSRVTVQSGRERSRGGALGGEASLTGTRASQDADIRLVRRPALHLPSGFDPRAKRSISDAKRAASMIAPAETHVSNRAPHRSNGSDNSFLKQQVARQPVEMAYRFERGAQPLAIAPRQRLDGDRIRRRRAMFACPRSAARGCKSRNTACASISASRSLSPPMPSALTPASRAGVARSTT